MKVTVAIPVRDGGAALRRTLQAVAKQTVEHELLVCDSGSTDGSAALARSHGARVLEIEPRSFSHGGTRNLLMREAGASAWPCSPRTPSRPTSAGWSACSAGFELAPDVGIVYGPYRPAPTRRRRCAWNSSAGSPRSPPTGSRAWSASAQTSARCPSLELIGRRGFFTDANACLARAAWERVPFREVPYAEDRVLAIDMLRAGYAKAFVPDGGGAALPRLHRARRSCAAASTSGAGCARSTAGASPPPPRTSRGSCGERWGRPRRELIREGASPARRRATLAAVSRHHVVRLAGALLGSRADLLPSIVRRRLSLERRAGFAPLDLDTSPIRLPQRPRTTLRDRRRQPETRSPDRHAESIAANALDGEFSGPLAGLRRRIYLTYRYLGWRTLLFRVLTFPAALHAAQAPSAAAHPRSDDACAAPWPGIASTAEPVTHRDPELPRRRAGGHARREHPQDGSARHGPHRRGRRRERPRARRGAAGDRGHRGRRGDREQWASPPTSIAACAPPTRPRDVVVLNSDVEARPGLAGVPAVRRLAGGGRRHRRRPAALSRRAHPVRRHGAQPRRARVVRPPLPLQARGLGSGRPCRARRWR